MASASVGVTGGGVGGAVLASGLLATVIAVSTSDSIAPTIAFAERSLPTGLRTAGAAALLVIVLTTWTLAGRHERSGLWLAVAQVSVLLPLLAPWSALPPYLAALTLATPPLAGICLARCTLAWGAMSTDPVVLAATALALISVALHALAYDPFRDPGCARTCAKVAAPLAGVASTHAVLVVTGGLGLASAALGVAAVVRRARRLPPALIAGTGLSFLGLVVVEVGAIASWSDPRTVGHLLLAQALVPFPLAIAALAATVSSSRTRRALDAVVDALTRRDALAAGRLVRGVEFADPDSDTWIDGAGQPARGQDGVGVLVVEDETGPAVRLTLAPGASPDAVRASLSPATMLALRNARLAATLDVRLAEVQSSRRRAVSLADAERRRIERDLHDGAQQRLVGVAFQLQLARSGADAPLAARIDRAEERVRDVLAQLRELSHGPIPQILAEEGLEPALQELALTSQVPLAVDVEHVGDLRDDAAVAAYVAVATCLSAAEGPPPARSVSVRVVSAGLGLAVTVRVAGAPPLVDRDAWVDAADRVGALGGSWQVTTDADQLVLEAVVPCA